jgi:CRISPR-associated protein Csm2
MKPQKARPQDRSLLSKPPDPDLETIMNGEVTDSARAIVEAAQAWGKYLVQEKLTTSQIRSIFGEVRRIQMNWSADAPSSSAALILLKPKLAYQAQRDAEKNRNTEPVRKLQRILEPAIDMVQGDYARFQRFVDFFEAILAYHKAEGGSDR